MSQRTMFTHPIRLVATVAVFYAVVFAVVMWAVPGIASAHHPLVSGVAECDDDTPGLYQVRWTVQPDAPRPGLEWTIGGAGTIPADRPFVFVERGLSQESITKTITATWFNRQGKQVAGPSTRTSAPVKRPSGCTPETTTTTTTTTTEPPETTTTWVPDTTTTTTSTSTTEPASTSTTDAPTTTAPETTSTSSTTTSTPPSSNVPATTASPGTTTPSMTATTSTARPTPTTDTALTSTTTTMSSTTPVTSSTLPGRQLPETGNDEARTIALAAAVILAAGLTLARIARRSA